MVSSILAVFVGAVLITAGVTKLIDGATFRASLVRLRLVPRHAQWPIARVLPPLEVVTGLAVSAVPSWWTFAIPSILFSASAAVLAYNLYLGDTAFNCGCFGFGESPLTWRVVGRPVLLLVATMIASGLAQPKLTETPLVVARMSLALAGSGLLIALLVWQQYQQRIHKKPSDMNVQ